MTAKRVQAAIGGPPERAAPSPVGRPPLAWRWVLLLVGVHALAFFLAFHPVALWPLAFVCAAPLAVAVRDARRRTAYAAGFVGFFLHGALAVCWLRLLDWPPWLGTAIGFALYGLVFALGARLAAASRAPATLWLPLVWSGLEHLRGTLFFYAFPWVYLGHAVYPLPMMQAADLGGQSLLSLAVALPGGLAVDLADALRGRCGLVTKTAWRRLLVRRGLPVAGVLLALNAYGVVRPRTIELYDGPRLLAVQSNLPQRLKLQSEMRPLDRLAHLTRLTVEGARGQKVDVIAWPETMLPIYRDPERVRPYLAIDEVPELGWLIAQEVGHIGAPILAGSGHAERRGDGAVAHNSIFHLAPDGRVLGRYDKVFLAPMSENAPLGDLWPAGHRWLRRNLIPQGFDQFEAGRSTRLFEVAGAKLGGSVCFDISFARASRDAVRAGAEAIVNVSNYAWFQDSAELDLARIHTRLRAIETRRAIACTVNAGITHFVDARGAVTDFVGPGGKTKEVPGTLCLPLRTSRARTLFVAIGESFAWSLVAGAALLGLAGAIRARQRPPA